MKTTYYKVYWKNVTPSPENTKEDKYGHYSVFKKNGNKLYCYFYEDCDGDKMGWKLWSSSNSSVDGNWLVKGTNVIKEYNKKTAEITEDEAFIELL